MNRLKREREEAKKLENAKAPADDAYQIDEHSEMRKFMKGTPGTKIPSKQVRLSVVNSILQKPIFRMLF